MGLQEKLSELKAEGIQLPKAIKKREGKIEQFDIDKIKTSILRAAERVGGHNEDIADQETLNVIRNLYQKGYRFPTVFEVSDATIATLKADGYDGTANSFLMYRTKRRKVKDKLKVLSSISGASTTDNFLMVSSMSEEMATPWDKNRIILSLIDDADLDLGHAKSISKEVENVIVLSDYGMITTSLIRELAFQEMLKLGLKENAERYKNISIPISDLEKILFSKNKENSNITTNNPEAVGSSIAGRVSKEYGLSRVFSRDIAEAHSLGELHLHDLDMVWRVYCSAHSLEYLKKNGLRGLENLQSTSSPPNHIRTLTEHLKTFFSTMQSYYAGALGVGHMNITAAPLVESDLIIEGEKKIKSLEKEYTKLIKRKYQLKKQGKDIGALEIVLKEQKERLMQYRQDPISVLDDREIEKFIRQEMQCLIFSGSQMAFARGGQSLFLDFNIHPGVPEYMRDTLAIGKNGKYMMNKNGKIIRLKERKLEEKMRDYHLIELIDPEENRIVMKERVIVKANGEQELVQEKFEREGEKIKTYGDYDKLSKKLAKAALYIWGEGDSDGEPFAFPKCDFHVSEESFSDPEQQELLKYACEVSSKNGSTYFVFDRDAVTLSACCRLRTAIEDNYVLKHPESMRFCGFQNVTINLPQAAYRAVNRGKQNLDGLLEEIDITMDKAVKAHLQKRDFIKRLQTEGAPQYQTGKISEDGLPYIELDKATYIIGILGLNEAYQTIYGKELHELTNKEFEDAVRVIAHMNIKTKEYSKKYGLKFALEETPAESTTRRVSKIDLMRFPEQAKKVVKGSIEDGNPYYTNSVHMRADAPIDGTTRIEMQSMFHPAIEAGAITHLFVQDKIPDPESIYNLVKKTFYNTQSAQLVISPEFTICRGCHTTHKGLLTECPSCHSKEKLKQMTRIVGYYSFIDVWNASKEEELKDRHKGNYQQGVNINGASFGLTNQNNGLTAYIIGKEGCSVCKSTRRVLESMLKRDFPGVPVAIEEYKANTEEGLTKAMMAGVNLSRIPYVIILDEKGGELYRKETKYNPKGALALPVKSEELTHALKNHLPA